LLHYSSDNYEDGKPIRQSKGRPIVTEQTCPDRLSPEEGLARHTLYQTVIDCYKIATGQWKHFIGMQWHDRKDSTRILTTARKHIESFIESDAFADYAAILGWEPDDAVVGVRAVLNGERSEEIAKLLKTMGKQPNEDAYNRERKE
jgi:hypothetical protein